MLNVDRLTSWASLIQIRVKHAEGSQCIFSKGIYYAIFTKLYNYEKKGRLKVFFFFLAIASLIIMHVCNDETHDEFTDEKNYFLSQPFQPHFDLQCKCFFFKVQKRKTKQRLTVNEGKHRCFCYQDLKHCKFIYRRLV